jgi:hypothetical protein
MSIFHLHSDFLGRIPRFRPLADDRARRRQLMTFGKCLLSFSVWLLYLTLGVIWLTKTLVLR